MAILKYTLLATLLLTGLPSMTVAAENASDEGNTSKELTEELARLRKESARLERENEKLIKRLDKERIATLEERCDSLAAAVETARAESLRSKHIADSLNAELDRLVAFKTRMVEEKAGSVSSYLANAYHALDSDSLQTLLDDISPLSPQSSKLSEIEKRLRETAERLELFNRFLTRYESQPYGDNLPTEFASLKNSIYTDSSPAQKYEIDSLESDIKAYPSAIAAFKGITEMVSYQLEYYRTNGGDTPQVKEFVNAIFEDYDPEKKAADNALISRIPYLRGLYDWYMELLLSDTPLDPEIVGIEETVSKM